MTTKIQNTSAAVSLAEKPSLSVNSSKLLGLLSKLAPFMDSRPIIPILENFLWTIEPGKLTVRVFDMRTNVVSSIEVDTEINLSICVPAKLLLDTLRGLPEQELSFVFDGLTATLYACQGKYDLPCDNFVDFPKTPTFNSEHSINVETALLSQAINSVAFFVSTDELRPAATGVFFDMQDGEMTLVGCDMNSLSCFTIHQVSDMDSFILPSKPAKLISRILPPEGCVTITQGKSNIQFEFLNYQIIVRLIDERYMDYRHILPKDYPIQVTVDRVALTSSLRRIMTYCNEFSHEVSLKLREKFVEIIGIDQDRKRQGNEKVLCAYAGQIPAEFVIKFSCFRLLSSLSILTCEEVTLCFSLPNRAGVLLPKQQPEGCNLLHLVMPIA